jgi:hypothetical protein
MGPFDSDIQATMKTRPRPPAEQMRGTVCVRWILRAPGSLLG